MRLAYLGSTVVRSLAPALAAPLHSSAASQAATATLAQASPTPIESALQGLLGLSSAEAHSLLAGHPDIGAVKPSVLLERVQFLGSGLGISSARLRSLVLQQPALLSDLSVRELRSMAGLGN